MGGHHGDLHGAGADTHALTTLEALQRARNAVCRAVNQSRYVKKANADIVLAIEGVTRAMTLLQERPELATLPSSHTATIRFTAPAPSGPPALDVALNNVNTAPERLAAAPGGDLSGMRARLVSDIAAAGRSILEAMLKANEA